MAGSSSGPAQWWFPAGHYLSKIHLQRLAPAVETWPVNYVGGSRKLRRAAAAMGGVSERLIPMGCPFPSPGKRGPKAPLGRLDHRDGGIEAALQLAG